MTAVYICTVSNEFPENYEIGLRVGKWGVEDKYKSKIARVRRGDLLIFAVGGAFRSIHKIASDPYHETTLVWPPKRGDIFPHRVDIGPSEVSGRVAVRDLAPKIRFMQGLQAWGGTLQGPNGVFNSRATPADVELITKQLEASEDVEIAIRPQPERPETIEVSPFDATHWLPGFLDQLAFLAALRAGTGLADPFAGADTWKRGLLTGIYADGREIPTVAVAPIDRSPQDTVLSTLYGLSSAKQSETRIKEVNAVIFVHDHHEEVRSLVRGVPNISTVQFDVHVSLRR